MSISPGNKANKVAAGELTKHCLRIIAFMKVLLKETAKILDGSFLIASDDGILPSVNIGLSCSKLIDNYLVYLS